MIISYYFECDFNKICQNKQRTKKNSWGTVIEIGRRLYADTSQYVGSIVSSLC